MKRVHRSLIIAAIAAIVSTSTSCSNGSTSIATYSVGGIATGLGSETLVVQINDEQNLTIRGDGPFVFSEAIPAGTAYDVQVVSGPCDTIRITNGTGTLDNEVRNVSIHCVRWHSPLSQEDTISPTGSDAEGPRIAMNSQGDAIMVWEQYNDISDYHVYMAQYRGGVWTKPTDLSTHLSMSGGEAWSPACAISDNGDAIVVYVQSSPGGVNAIIPGTNRVYMSELRNGTWTHPQNFDTALSNVDRHASTPSVAMSPTGEAVITWRELDGQYGLYRSEYRNGSWTHPSPTATPFSPSGQHAYDPQVALAADGQAVIVWRQLDPSRYQVFKSEYRNGAWTDPTGLTDNISPDTQHAYDLRLAIAANGDTSIIWRQYNGSVYRMLLSDYRNGTWTHPTSLNDSISPDNRSAYSGRVGMAPDGRTVIAWIQYDGTRERVFVSEFESSAWTHPADLDDSLSTGSSADELDVAFAGDKAIIAYIADYGSYQNCFALERRGGTWQPITRLAPVLTSCESPAVAVSANGDAMICWDAYINNAAYQVFSSHYH